jgi:hypothetical protein
LKKNTAESWPAFDRDEAEKGFDEDDWSVFNRLTSIDLSDEELARAAAPDRAYPEIKEFLAVHWHPEWAPMEAIAKRLAAAFPRAENSLVIPTQHNRVMTFGEWAGVEADVYDRRYMAKVQLLIHFKADKLPRAAAFVAMMNRTYDYRALQLLDILGRLTEPDKAALKVQASLACSVRPEAVAMARFFAARLRALINGSGLIGARRGEMLKNRLLHDFMSERLGATHRALAEQANLYIEAIKKTVKAQMRPEQFYSPQEVIEEARSLGGGVVIPHPPLFWPILISGLDVDGWEVWNSSTPHHTLFLLEALARANEGAGRRRLLAFMGDDTHMSAKLRTTAGREKAAREIGFQPPWFEPEARALLKKTGQSLAGVINEYRARLS